MPPTAPVLPWLEYRWSFDQPVGMFAALQARLAGTPARLETLLAGRDRAELDRREPGHWSVRENAGHLVMVERLWQVRIEEYLAGAAVLTAADMSNRATARVDWSSSPVGEILAGFRAARSATLERLAPLDLEDAARTAHHPRLDRSMRLVDLCFFAAEHDDHHVGTIIALLG